MDLTVGVGKGTLDWGSADGHGPELRRLISRRADGDIANISELRMNAHTGTHLDAPSHFVEVRNQDMAPAAACPAEHEDLHHVQASPP